MRFTVKRISWGSDIFQAFIPRLLYCHVTRKDTHKRFCIVNTFLNILFCGIIPFPKIISKENPEIILAGI
jgi:hypothetical protein